ncbi:MAG TPA: hypothetical protein VG777_06960, partial [Thermoanaerobaculia bacterium]|nr:hypothetical protein [Thermoanaerobaculia bacterium]
MTGRAAASPAHVAVGDPIRVTVSLDAPPRSTVVLRNPRSTSELTRVAASPWTYRREGATGRLERVETWEAFTPGATPAFRYAWSIRPGAGPVLSGEAATAPVTVASVLPPGNPPQPAGLRPPVTRTFVAWQVVAALLLAAAIAAAFAVLLRRRRRGVTRVRDADDVFDGELVLLESSLAKDGPEEAFYDWLAEISRWYLEQKLGMPAPRLTSAEIVARLRDPSALPRLPLPRAAEAAAGVATLFSVCDGDRFAR